MHKHFQHAHKGHRSLKRHALALTCLAVLAGSALPSAVQAASPNHIQISRQSMGATQHVEVGLNKSLIVDLPVDAREVIVSSPTTATAIMRSKRRAIVQGMAVGETNIFFLDANGNRISVVEVSVTQDSSGLESIIARLLPGSHIRVETIATAGGARVVLSGTAQSSDDAAKAAAVAAQFAGGDANVANVVAVDGAQQVALKVTIAEVSREAVKQLGINFSASASVGGMTTSFTNTPALGGASNVLPSGSLGVSGGIGGVQLDATLRALERRGAMRTLAEPTLTALSGQEATFLAGGEFPVPSGVDNGTVSFTFKEFGVKLTFTPVVMSGGLIGLTVNTSVSEPTTEGGFSLNGVTIPATKERQASTSVQLRSGGTLAIAGLIQDQVRQQFNSIPGLDKLPILGALFRSRDFVHSQTELVIMVTPSLATPGPVDLPTDHMVFAGDAEAIFLGHMEKLYGVGNCNCTNQGGGFRGSIGFVLD